jgi:hypothetical protein
MASVHVKAAKAAIDANDFAAALDSASEVL